MEKWPSSFISFVITSSITVLAVITWTILVATNGSIRVAAFVLITELVALLLSPFGFYTALKFTSSDPAVMRQNKIALRGNGIFSVTLVSIVIFFILLELRIIVR